MPERPPRNRHRSRWAAAGTRARLPLVCALLLLAPGCQDSAEHDYREPAPAAPLDEAGKRDLMELAARQERFFAQHGRYTTDIASDDGLALKRTDSADGRYRFTAAPGACGDIHRCYLLQAIPGTPGEDAAGCGTLGVDSLGGRYASGPRGDLCW